MRVSGLSINLQSYNIIHNTSNRYNKILMQQSSGMKIQKGHEDPVLAQKAISLQNTLKANEQYLKNINDAKSTLDFTESIFSQASDMLTRARELAIQASTDTINSESREAIVKEFDQLILEFANMGNQQHNGKYIFAGTNTTTKPFEIVGNPPDSVKYHGNNNDISYNILDNYNLSTNVTGDRSFEVIINNMISVRNDIRDGNLDEVSKDGLESLDKTIDSVINIRTELGAKSKIVEATLERVKTLDLETTAAYSDLMGVDIAEKSIEAAGVELSYQASLSVVGKLYDMSLLNYMK